MNRVLIQALLFLMLIMAAAACGGDPENAGKPSERDASRNDAGLSDLAAGDLEPADASPADAGPPDSAPADVSPGDAQPVDGGDAGPPDSGPPPEQPEPLPPLPAPPPVKPGEYMRIELMRQGKEGYAMFPIDNSYFTWDPYRQIIGMSYNMKSVNLNVPTMDIAVLNGLKGEVMEAPARGQVLPPGTNFCNDEEWCMFPGGDPETGDIYITGSVLPKVMKLQRTATGYLGTVMDVKSDPRIGKVSSYISWSVAWDWKNKFMYQYGALGPRVNSKVMWRIDLQKAEIIPFISDLPGMYENCMAVDANKNRLFSIGGTWSEKEEQSDTLDSMEIFDLSTQKRETVTGLPFGRRNAMSCAFDAKRNRLFVMGGYTPAAYNPKCAGASPPAMCANRITQEFVTFHNDLWMAELENGAFKWTKLIDQTPAGELKPIRDGDKELRLHANRSVPNFGMSPGSMLYIPQHDYLMIGGKVPAFDLGTFYYVNVK
ncbi:MAG: hypothetical protein GMKNLPBB_01538 [Myxococcota bacterium]|nr:hypothetical protein [Myxococcota bacterium]